MSNCVVCKGAVDRGALLEEDFGYIFEQADMLGMDSLTENEQVVYEGSCCGQECFDKLQ